MNLFLISAQGEVQSLSTDKKSYYQTNKIILSGIAATTDAGSQVNLEITGPQGNYIDTFTTTVNTDGSFQFVLDTNTPIIQNDFSHQGIYSSIAFILARSSSLPASFDYSPLAPPPLRPLSMQSNQTSIQNNSHSLPQLSPPSLTLYNPSTNGLTVTIDGNTQGTTPGSDITNVNWDWGDGQTTTGLFPQTHTYSSSGTYTVKVTAYDSYGSTRWETENVIVKPVLTPPSLTLYNPLTNGLTVTIKGYTQATSPTGSITMLNWDWGDGYTTTGFFPQTHTYSNGGTYTVKVTTHDSYGSTRFETLSLTIIAPQPTVSPNINSINTPSVNPSTNPVSSNNPSSAVNPAIIGLIAIISVGAVVGIGIRLARRRKVSLVKTTQPTTKPTRRSIPITSSHDDTMFYGCPHCGGDTQIRSGKQYCQRCNMYL
ncbi:MAG: PKD domain-containing protein [Nitrosopumilaceae archaeon]